MMYLISLLLSLTGYCTANNQTGLIIADPFDSNKIPISIGPQYFENLLRDSEVLVDKSLLIKEIVEDVGKVFLITCPRRWGKSTNLDMMKTFFEIPTPDNSTSPITPTSRYRLFVSGQVENGKKFKSPLRIAEYPQIVDNYLGKYPVIFVTNLGRIFIDEFGQQLRGSVGKIFHEYLYLKSMLERATKNGTKIEAERLEKFERYVSGKDITVNEFIESLHFLSELLHLYFNKKVFIFIDEYQSPWEEVMLLSSPSSGENSEKFFKIYSNFLEKTFITNKYLEKGILTGIPFVLDQLRRFVFKEVIECNSLTGKFMEYYGFNQWEMTSFFELLKTPTSKQKEAIQWYGSYKVNNTNLQIFNTWSIANYLKEYRLDTYWINTWVVSFENFLDMNTFRNRFHYLIDGNNITVQFRRQYFTWQEFEQLFNIRIGRGIVSTADALLPDMAFRFLYTFGYLTLSEDFNPDLKYFKMRFPNEEIRVAMKDHLLKYYYSKLQFDDTSKDLVSGELLKCIHNDEIACPNLKDILDGHMPLRIIMQETDNENILHLMLCWLLIDVKCLQKEFHASSEKNVEQPQVLLVFENRTVIIHATYGEAAAYIAFRHAQSYANIIPQLKYPVKEVKYIGINVHVQKHVDICGEIVKMN